VGRDPSEIERTVVISESDLGDVDAFIEAGATHVIVMVGHPFDFTSVQRLLDTRG
jgi:hypothetical protein